MKIKMTLTALCAASMLAAAPLAVQAQDEAPARGDRPARAERGDRGQRGGGEMGPMGMMFRGLDLTEEQQAQMREVGETHRKKVEEWREKNGEKLKQMRTKMRDAWVDGNLDEASETEDEMRDLQNTAPTQMDAMFAARKVLTDEQAAKIGERMEQMQERMEQMREGMQERRDNRGGEGEASPERRRERKDDGA